MSNELSIIEQVDHLLPTKDILDRLKAQAQALVDAGMLPPGYKTASDALVVALRARELGVLPMRGWQGMFPMKGRIGYMGAFLLGLLWERVPQAEVIVEENTKERCKLKVRRNSTEDYLYVEVTMEEAKACKWDLYWDDKASSFKQKPTWSDPANMLYWRAITRAFNRYFSHITGGAAVYTRDELEDIPETQEIPASERAAADALPYVANGKNGAANKPALPPPPPPPPPPAAGGTPPSPFDKETSTNIPTPLDHLKTELAFCDSAPAVKKVWDAFRVSTTDGKLLNEGLALKKAREAEVAK